MVSPTHAAPTGTRCGVPSGLVVASQVGPPCFSRATVFSQGSTCPAKLCWTSEALWLTSAAACGCCVVISVLLCLGHEAAGPDGWRQNRVGGASGAGIGRPADAHPGALFLPLREGGPCGPAGSRA